MQCGVCGGDHQYWDCPIVIEQKRCDEHNEQFQHRRKIEEELKQIRELLEGRRK